MIVSSSAGGLAVGAAAATGLCAGAVAGEGDWARSMAVAISNGAARQILMKIGFKSSRGGRLRNERSTLKVQLSTSNCRLPVIKHPGSTLDCGICCTGCRSVPLQKSVNFFGQLRADSFGAGNLFDTRLS